VKASELFNGTVTQAEFDAACAAAAADEDAIPEEEKARLRAKTETLWDAMDRHVEAGGTIAWAPDWTPKSRRRRDGGDVE
jgi:hypothetical protein